MDVDAACEAVPINGYFQLCGGLKMAKKAKPKKKPTKKTGKKK